MQRDIVTITSKNQITLPSKYVRKIGLQKKQKLTIRMRGDELVLKPAPSVEEIMADTWSEIGPHVKKPLTDEELEQAIREAAAHGAWDKEK